MSTRVAAIRRQGIALVVGTMVAAAVFVSGSPADAAIVPTINLATAANFSVLAGSSVTNTGPSVLGQSVGVSPGSSVIGFDNPGGPGTVLAPGTVEVTTPVADQAQLDLTAAYTEAMNRPVNATLTDDLTGLTLQGGVYATTTGPIQLTGALVLDGAGDPNSVFIFQSASSLVTGSSSTVQLINGAQACNVFWQVTSDATLDTGSTFAGNIMALTSVTVNTGVTVQGRALARNAEVTLDNDVFTAPSCDLTLPTTTTTAAPGSGETATTTPGETDTDTPGGGGPTSPPDVPPVAGPPRTGGAPVPTDGSPWPALFLTALGAASVGGFLRHRAQARRRALAEQ